LVNEGLEHGDTLISIRSLLPVIASGRAANTQAKIEYEHKMKLFEVEAPLEVQKQLEMFKATLETGQTALKSLTLINGGAALALLTFIGTIVTKEPDSELITVATLYGPMMTFVAGLGLAGLASAARYISQDLYNVSQCWGHIFKALAVASGVMSLIAFGYGSYWSGEALLTSPK
jgi:hypothetical protein